MNLQTILRMKGVGQKIGFTASAFELGPHAGHMAMLAEAKSKCDFLVVGLLTDPTISRPDKHKPIQSTLERWVQVSSCVFVDMVIPFDSEKDLSDMLHIIMPDIRFVGEEYKGKPHTGSDIDGIEVYYNKRTHTFSSSDLRARVIKSVEVKNEKS